MNRFQCVVDHQRRYGVNQLCSWGGHQGSDGAYARIMREHRIEKVRLRRRHRTTVPIRLRPKPLT
ncbi:hypothetical protein ACFW9I_32060 [[Kitasatospora] papulosa]|uniref:hypothetical protein n=1 Tax=[Kitasatospora] papulosa TaxID=1464011 RepID=UPI0036CE3C31